MPKNSLALERQWFKKLNNLNSGTYRLAHAMRNDHYDNSDSSTSFNPDPAKVAKGIKATARQHLADHIAAVKK